MSGIHGSAGTCSPRERLRGVPARGIAACVLGLLAFAPVAAGATFSNPAPITIYDDHPTFALGPASPYPSPITVSGLSGVITDVDVSLSGYGHKWPGDVGVVLVGPAGQALLLMDGVGDDRAFAVFDVNLTFDDEAAAFAEHDGVPFTGSYKPTAYFVNDSFPAPGPLGTYGRPGPTAHPQGPVKLDTFDGSSPNGEWKLFVADFAKDFAGRIARGWSLKITTSDVTPPDTKITAGPSGSISTSSAAFSFASNEPGSTFRCKLDGPGTATGSYTACDGGSVSYGGLSNGTYAFSVFATDAAGNADPSPAGRAFTVACRKRC